MIHRCISRDCGLTYRSDHQTPGVCPACWVKRNPERTGHIAGGLVWQVRNLQAQVDRLQAQPPPPPRQAPPSPIPEELVKRLLGLIHPDRHGGSAVATRAFQDLQSLSASGGRHGTS